MEQDVVPVPPMPHRSLSQAKPKGILKNAPPANPNQNTRLQWDEANIALTEIQKDSLMKITEPKTPFVRYNAMTDEVEGFSNDTIPNFSLDGKSPVSSPTSSEPQAIPGSHRRDSVELARSGSSSRSTSFSLPNLPNGAPRMMRDEDGRSGAGEIEEDEEMDAELAEKHREFVRARGRHYSNEAEAMKRAQALMAQDDDEENESAPVSDSNEDEDQKPNGTLNANN
jgi:protein phosphatase inhibitor 2